MASAAVFQPCFHANSAIADPSSCATLPKLKASLPFVPKRFGPIWSVPMHGATARIPRLIASWTTGVAKSTSQVTNTMSAPFPIRLAAHALALAGALFCVSHVMILSLRPLTPPFALICLTLTFAAARAGPSNGAMLPLPSNAHPITIGSDDAAGAVAAVTATTTVSVASNAASAPVFLDVITPPGALDGLTRFLARTPPSP